VLVGTTTLRALPRTGLGLVVIGVPGQPDGPAPYLDGILSDPTSREAFFALVDAEGLVVARNLEIDPQGYRHVGGSRGQGRLSQGEYFHHDGCSSPTRPRVVEIRCPPQPVVRAMGTSVSLFPGNVRAMLRALPAARRAAGGLDRPYAADRAGEEPDGGWEHVQGLINRVLRHIDVEDARAFLQEVDEASSSFREPWTLGESRFMANANATQTVQHRRACLVPWTLGTPNGQLLKRWPAEELTDTPLTGCAPCTAKGRPWSAARGTPGTEDVCKPVPLEPDPLPDAGVPDWLSGGGAVSSW
jgi:hypothetical protein